MKNAKSNEENFNYKKAITEEDKEFERGSLEARQKKVVDSIMEDLNSKEGGTKKMKSKSGVKTKVATKKVVLPKVDMVKQKQKAISILNELKSSINCNSLKLSPTNTNYCSFTSKNRIIFGTRYGLNGKIGMFFKITEKEFKESLPTFKGSYTNGFGEYVLPDKEDVTRFKILAELAVKNIPKTKPVVKKVVAKVIAKKPVKKNKPIKRTI